MTSYRTLAGVFYLIGLGSLWIGGEAALLASCEVVEHEPATCTKAYAGAPVPNGSSTYCDTDSGPCQPSEGSACEDSWGVAYEGECDFQAIGTGDPHICYEDAFLTVIDLPYFSASCEGEGSSCGCEWEETTTTTTVQLCDCYDD